jgi:hypothetical protein
MSEHPLVRFIGRSGAVHLCREYVKGYADASARAGSERIPIMGHFCQTCGVEARRVSRGSLECTELVSPEQTQGT